MKNNLILFVVSLFLGTFFVSCGEPENIVPHATEHTTDLSDRLADNTNFQEIVTMFLLGQVNENSTHTIINHTHALLSEIPELINLDKEAYRELAEQSFQKLEDIPVSSRCANPSGYWSCNMDAHADYVFSYNNCNSNSCRNSATRAYNQAAQLCVAWYC